MITTNTYPLNFIGSAIPLGPTDINTEATTLNCEAAAVGAVCDIESAGTGFLKTKQPQILFESHIFSQLTKGQFDTEYPDISTPSWVSNYGPGGIHQYSRLQKAMNLDTTAALEAASWGMFQILGFNYSIAGYISVYDMVNATCRSELDHLQAFGNFCNSNHLTRYLISHDWVRFAIGYNGSGEASNDYDQKLKAAYEKRLGNPYARILHLGMTCSLVGTLQTALNAANYGPIVVDNTYGTSTFDAVWKLELDNKIQVDGIAGPMVFGILKLNTAQAVW